MRLPIGLRWHRLTHWPAAVSWLLVMGCLVGCVSRPLGDSKQIDELTASTSDAQLVGDLSRPWGLTYQVADGVGLVVGLAGTGSDPPPSTERTMLIADMRARGVDKPNSVLASPATALVTVRAILPPGVRKGDPIDVEVSVPRFSNTTSLRSGWLMKTRLREYGRVKDRVAAGHVLALAQGDVLVDALVEGSDDPTSLVRGCVLGGGVSTKTRNLGLIIRDEYLSVKTSAQIGEAINQRFHIYDGGVKRGVATPMRDNFVELLVHPRYDDNIMRYMRVIQGVPVRESAAGVTQRMAVLKEQLLDAGSSSRAALQLEALGNEAAPVLVEGMKSSDPEVRFYAAEALAYLDDPQAVGILADTILKETAFRWRALMALQIMEHSKAHAALSELLHAESAEARYGAFRALRLQMPDDPLIAGEFLGKQFYYHTVATVGEPLVHVAREERPEIVVFGKDIQLSHPVVLFTGNRMVVKSQDDGQLKVTRLGTGEDEQSIVCPTELDAVIRALVELGASFPDVVQAISTAKEHGCLACRLEFSALPRPGRTYHRDADDGAPVLDLEDASDDELNLSESDEAPTEDGELAPDEQLETFGPETMPSSLAPEASRADGEVPAIVLPPDNSSPRLPSGDLPHAGEKVDTLEGLDTLHLDPLGA